MRPTPVFMSIWCSSVALPKCTQEGLRLVWVLDCPHMLVVYFSFFQDQTASTWIWSWRSWWRPVREESHPLPPFPPRRPHPHPVPPPAPLSAPQKDWRYTHTSDTHHLPLFFVPSYFSFHLVGARFSFSLASLSLDAASKLQSNQLDLIDPVCQPADPLYSSVSWTTSCRTIVYPSCPYKSVKGHDKHTHALVWHCSALYYMQTSHLLTMTFSDCWVCMCVCVRGWGAKHGRELFWMLVSISSDVNIESTRPSDSLNICLIDFECREE